MASISLPRPQRPAAKHNAPMTSTARSLSRKASIVSVKSDKDRPYIDPDDDYPLFTAPYDSPRRYLPSPPVQSNTELQYPSPPTRWNGTLEDPPKSRKHQSKPSVKSVSSLRDRSKDRKGKEKEKGYGYSYSRYDDDEDLQHDIGPFGLMETPKSRSRARPATSPTQSDWRDVPPMPYYRDSGSSSLSQFETPPHTPVDDFMSLRGSLERISVVAPVFGVEQMDAMVDGLNSFGGGDRDSFFGRALPSLRSSKAERAGFHPLYQPPLPTPPPGVKLGGGRSRKVSERSSARHSEDDEENLTPSPEAPAPARRKPKKVPSFSRSESSNTVTPQSHQRAADVKFPAVNPSIDEIIQRYAPESRRRQPVPSISEIIRAHGPKQISQTSQSSRQFSIPPSQQISLDYDEPDMEPLTAEEEAEMISRSSVDSVAEEVQKTMRNQSSSPPARPLQRANSFAYRQSYYPESVADASIRSPRSDGASLYSYSVISEPSQPPPFDFLNTSNSKPLSASQAIAQYLRSVRLTTLLKLICAPHASRDHPLTVSLSDLGSPTGFPLVVFLGLGCVRHVMGLYDEMAECLGLRLITIDRWGLGRTQTPTSKLARGIPEWSSVVAEVLDRLGIEKCAIMAHSAGAPYALAFANQYPERIRGDICLLAPWIGEGAGYKWLKYVPNGILKTAQAAEWKVQAWMLGKPPTISYEGIGYNMQAPISSSNHGRESYPPYTAGRSHDDEPTSPTEAMRRPSIGSSIFSEYDDLRDFDGRFESQSTVGAKSIEGSRPRTDSLNKRGMEAKRKSSKGFLGKLRGTSNSQPPSPSLDKASPVPGGRRLKALRSMSSLRSKASSAPGTMTRMPSSSSITPQLPLRIDVGLGLDEIRWSSSPQPSPLRETTPAAQIPVTPNSRASGNRAVSFSAGAQKSPMSSSLPPSPMPSSAPPSPADVSGGSYQAMLGNALIAASHAESAKGTHSDLVQILNHDRLPWGFSYSEYPHNVRVWYGDRDERIAESAVRWLERTMGPNRCHVNVVKGADHGLMYKSSVVIDVFEQVHDYSRD